MRDVRLSLVAVCVEGNACRMRTDSQTGPGNSSRGIIKHLCKKAQLGTWLEVVVGIVVTVVLSAVVVIIVVVVVESVKIGVVFVVFGGGGSTQHFIEEEGQTKQVILLAMTESLHELLGGDKMDVKTFYGRKKNCASTSLNRLLDKISEKKFDSADIYIAPPSNDSEGVSEGSDADDSDEFANKFHRKYFPLRLRHH
nr:unnamed protein product [Callosobruchus chinensis]